MWFRPGGDEAALIKAQQPLCAQAGKAFLTVRGCCIAQSLPRFVVPRDSGLLATDKGDLHPAQIKPFCTSNATATSVTWMGAVNGKSDTEDEGAPPVSGIRVIYLPLCPCCLVFVLISLTAGEQLYLLHYKIVSAGD